MKKKKKNKIKKFLKLFEIEDLKNIEEDYIHKKYKKLALKLHPDKGGNKEDFQELQESYDTLLLLHSLDNKNVDEDNDSLSSITVTISDIDEDNPQTESESESDSDKKEPIKKQETTRSSGFVRAVTRRKDLRKVTI